MDTKVVMAMYTECDPTKSSSVMRRKKDGTRESISCPVAIKIYNEKMGGVDRGAAEGLLSCEDEMSEGL